MPWPAQARTRFAGVLLTLTLTTFLMRPSVALLLSLPKHGPAFKNELTLTLASA
jgi:hypothetical protein